MKYLKTYSEFINESYQDLSERDFQDEYDEKFANYALNERPFYLSDEDVEECKKIYGNRDVGIVYHGGKIDSLEYLNIIENLKKGDILNMKFKSCSPYFDEAQSFAFYIKSYDEYTMISNLKD